MEEKWIGLGQIKPAERTSHNVAVNDGGGSRSMKPAEKMSIKWCVCMPKGKKPMLVTLVWMGGQVPMQAVPTHGGRH